MNNRTYNFQVRDKIFDCGTHVMAIVNVNGDSFWAPSRHSVDNILFGVEKCLSEGAEIIDFGAQSTRPNAPTISALEEMTTIVPAIECVRKEFGDILISVDTFYADVAQAVIDVGADMINDVSMFSDSAMAQIVAQNDVAVCVMHNRRKSKNPDLFFDKEIGLLSAVSKLEKAGVKQNKVLLDGGIGFNLSHDEDWALLEGYDKLMDMLEPYPFLLGTSRKSMFGGDVSARLSATLDSTVLAVKKGVLFVRVHDVKENVALINCYK